MDTVKIIGITGGTGAGKTTALGVLKRMGAYVIDCDALYHELLTTSVPMKNELKEKFPEAFEGGNVDLKKLGAIVFGDPALLRALNSITHKYVLEEIEQTLNEKKDEGVEIAAVDAILLLESGLSGLCDLTVGVLSPPHIRRRRIMERENIGEEYAQSRIRAQKSDEFYRAGCDYVLENAYETKAEFERACERLFGQILSERGG